MDAGHGEQSEELRAALVLMPAKPYTGELLPLPHATPKENINKFSTRADRAQTASSTTG